MDGLPPSLPPSLSPAAPPALGALLAAVTMMVDEQRTAVLHVTAARHGEGTTTVARELAAAIARQSWCGVALIDAAPIPEVHDAPSLLARLRRGEPPLLRSGRIGAVPVAIGRLTGPGEDPPRLEQLRTLFTGLRERFTVTIIDCPPVLSCRESAVVAAVADGTLLVVEAERTRRADIAVARDVLGGLGATMLGLVLNKRQQRVPRLIERMM